MANPISLDSRSEIRLFMQAINTHWPIDPAPCDQAIERLAGMVGIAFVNTGEGDGEGDGDGEGRTAVESLENVPRDKHGKPDARLMLAATRALAAYHRISIAQQRLDIARADRKIIDTYKYDMANPPRPMTPEEVKVFLAIPIADLPKTPPRETAYEREETRRCGPVKWAVPRELCNLVIERVLSLIGLARHGSDRAPPLVNFAATGPRDFRLELAAHRVLALLARLGIAQEIFELKMLERADDHDYEYEEMLEKRRGYR